MQKATIVKIGNSLGVRLKHQLIADLGVQPGDEVEISVWPSHPLENSERFITAMKQAHTNGGVVSIPSPVRWQSQQRKDRPLPGRS